MIIESVPCKDCHYRYRDYLGIDKCCNRELIKEKALSTGKHEDSMSCFKIQFFPEKCKQYVQASFERRETMNHVLN